MRKNYLLIILICCGLFLGFAQQENTIQKPVTALETIVSIDADQLAIEKILFMLEENNSFSFSYINSEIPLKRKVSVTAQNEPLGNVLETVFQNTLIDYLGYEDQVVLVKKDDIEFLEEIKETTNATNFYLPSVSEYYSATSNKGRYVVLDELLKTLIEFYKNQVKPIEKTEVAIDTVAIDSLDLNVKDTLAIHRKKKKIKLPKITFRNIEVTYGFTANTSSNFWTFETNKEQRDFNENSVPDLSLSVGAGVYFEGKHAITSLGLNYSYLQKNGSHTDFLINTVRPDTVLTRKTVYNENYHFIDIPLKVGFKIPGNRVSYLVQPGITVHRLLKSNTSDTYRIYQDQYFTNLNINSANNPDLSPYFDRNFVPIQPDETSIRKWNSSVSFSFKIVTKLNDTWKILIGPELQYSLFSLYNKDAPLTQNRIQAGIGIIFSPVFPFM